ncbi:MAG TPA: cytochrome P450 [Leptospiraceae bacterium]|nr:cytochrome P450 [Leptospiraceae bacterium]HMW06358.1 cytochrome P450 [Leptospiraceae bacterium]HMX30963.1 cytochrome P450 [Leptospiraceae bacterium]HMY34311.1 cytochrome P450 [Leptospiraceae bacterium]HMZ63781.1 cytochrome P450 [Leptospiraceae bacterium]
MPIPSITGWKALKKSSQLKEDTLGFFVSQFEEYGDLFHFNLLGLNMFIMRDPILIRYVLQENNGNYTKSIFYKELERLIGKGLLTSEGSEWKKNRRLTQSAFKKSSIEGFSQIFYEESDRLVGEWKDISEVDMSKEMMRLTFRIVGRSLFSAKLDEDTQIVDESLGIALEEITRRIQSPIKIPFILPTPRNRRLKKAVHNLDSVVNKIISNRIKSGERVKDLLDTLIYARDEETQQGLSPKQIRDEVITFLSAGHETTSNALTWTFYLLSEHSEVRKKVIEEIRSNIPSTGQITISQLEKLKLTERVLKESMRLFPPAWIIERMSIKEDTIGETKIGANSLVSVCTYAVHRNPKYWNNPELFDPDRFLPEEEEKRHNFAYIPFGGGPRVCIGNNFAVTEAMTALACILRSYEPTLIAGHPVVKEPLVTLRPKFGMKMHLNKR